ncbi:MASE1 domain-containing protein [Candidatus Binatus sp.]|uniref:hybrid sensor histidine kinase/response regulator n=1 Tax=Candidatus Binatus sp. TaxID=2811406 RepID=UPI003C81537F
MATLKLNDTVPTPSERSTTLSAVRRRLSFDADLQNLAWIAAVAVIYYAAGRLGLYFASFSPSSSPVWPPTGIAFAALLLLGYQIWPGVFLGAFFVNLAVSGAVFASLAIATGNTLEAVVAVYLTMRYANGRKLFEHAQDFFRFAALGMLAAALSASIGVISLALGGLAHSNEFARIWLTWWLGDVGGFLLFAPFPILWIERPRSTGDHRRPLESSLTLAAVALFGILVFAGAVPGIEKYPIGFICIPILVWTAFRFGQREAAAAIFVLTVCAEWGMMRGHGPWARFASLISSDIIPQAFLLTMAVMTMALAAVVWERKRAEEDANEARNQAVAANRAKDQFLAMLGHELRNPIAALSSAIRVLEHTDVLSNQYSNLLEIMVRQSGHLSRMVDDLLDVQRLTASRITLNRRPMNLAECARDCVTALRLREGYADHNIVLRIEDTWIDGDPDRIAQILTNLLSNACKYTRPQGKIVLSIRPENDYAFICVEDDGDGIPADLLPHIFELFVQGDRLSDRHPGGLGLGLTLVRRLSELHGGTIDAHSDGPGRGSKFTLRIPRIEARIVAQTTATRTAPVRSRRGRRILIVEDNTDAREALRVALEMSGHEIFEADSGASGVESALANHPDAALIDIGLPGFDGYEVARRIRSSAENRGIMLIALTGYGSPEDRRRAKQAGFDTHLVKPLNFDLLDDLLTTPGEPILEKSAASQS